MAPIVLTTAELADLLDCGAEQVELKAREGVLPGVKFGRTWVFPLGALAQALNALAMAEAFKRSGKPGGDHGAVAANDSPTPAPVPVPAQRAAGGQRARGGPRRSVPPSLSPPPP